MVQFGDDLFRRVADGGEIHHALVLVQRAGDFRRHAITVSVQPLAGRRPPA